MATPKQASSAAVRDALFETFAALSARHSPSGVEGEVDGYLMERLATAGAPRLDGAGNVVVRVPGGGEPPVAILAHKDEIGALVKRVEEGGRLRLAPVGGSFPWVWGEGAVEVLGRHATVTGVLSFGSRHVSDESPQREQQRDAALRWKDAYVETKLDERALARAGVRPGSRIVPAAARKAPIRLGADGEYLAGFALDDKAAVAALVELAGRLEEPRCDVELVFSAREEIGCHGAKWYAQRTDAEALVALEVTPVAGEYGIEAGPDPVLVVADSNGPLSDALAAELEDAAAAAGIELGHAVVSSYGSDASNALSAGLLARTACLAFATENTHGYEIAHLDAIAASVAVLEQWLSAP